MTEDQIKQLEGLIDRAIHGGRPMPGAQGMIMALAWKVRELEKQVLFLTQLAVPLKPIVDWAKDGDTTAISLPEITCDKCGQSYGWGKFVDHDCN